MPEPSWVSLSDEELLGVRMCDLGVGLEGTAVEQRINSLKSQLGITPQQQPLWDAFAQTMRDPEVQAEEILADSDARTDYRDVPEAPPTEHRTSEDTVEPPG